MAPAASDITVSFTSTTEQSVAATAAVDVHDTRMRTITLLMVSTCSSMVGAMLRYVWVHHNIMCSPSLPKMQHEFRDDPVCVLLLIIITLECRSQDQDVNSSSYSGDCFSLCAVWTFYRCYWAY